MEIRFVSFIRENSAKVVLIRQENPVLPSGVPRYNEEKGRDTFPKEPRMKKKLNKTLLAAVVCGLCLTESGALAADDRQSHMLVLQKNSKAMLLDGRQRTAAQPIVFANGVSYAPLNGLAQSFGFRLAYDRATGEAVATSGATELRFGANSGSYKLNGERREMDGQAYLLNGSLMVPLRSWSTLVGAQLSVDGTMVTLRWTPGPVAAADKPGSATEESVAAAGQPPALRVSEDGRNLVRADGEPFFWLGDTAWELLHRLTREEATAYLRDAAANGFTVVQAVGISETSGGYGTNAYGDPAVYDGDPTRPGTEAGIEGEAYDYWDHADFIIDTAASLGLYVAFLPSWGQYLWSNAGQPATVLFNVHNAKIYGAWLGERYKEKTNLIWVLGGDRIPDTEEKRALVRALAGALEDAGATQLKTYHPWGQKSSSEWFHADEWLDFNMFQSGHAGQDYPNYTFAVADYGKRPIKPTLDGEPRYEHLPVRFDSANGRFDAYDVRQAAYWSVFAGSFGHTYGHNSLWQMYAPDRKPLIEAEIYWQDAIKAEGRMQMKILRELIESRPMKDRVPDQTLLEGEGTGGGHIRATRGADYAMIYSARGEPVRVRLGAIAGETVTVRWMNPRTGDRTAIGDFANGGTHTFTPPTNGVGQDWVLQIDDKSAGYP